jgi:hypothetical protein
LWGGIHILHDDFDGRRIGDRIGVSAIERAAQVYGAAAP